MKKVSTAAKVIDTLLLAIIVVVSASIRDAALLRWLMEAGFTLALCEIFLTAYVKREDFAPKVFGLLPENVHFILITTAIMFGASIAVFLASHEQNEYVLVIACVVSADAGGLFFGRLFGRKHPRFSAKLSPNKTWAGYLGEFITCWCVGSVVLILFHINVNRVNCLYVALAPIFGIIGDLSASGAKRQLGIKNSGEEFRNVPIIGNLEWFIKSRDGFLDCFDSIASAYVFYTIARIL